MACWEPEIKIIFRNQHLTHTNRRSLTHSLTPGVQPCLAWSHLWAGTWWVSSAPSSSPPAQGTLPGRGRAGEGQSHFPLTSDQAANPHLTWRQTKQKFLLFWGEAVKSPVTVSQCGDTMSSFHTYPIRGIVQRSIQLSANLAPGHRDSSAEGCYCCWAFFAFASNSLD